MLYTVYATCAVSYENGIVLGDPFGECADYRAYERSTLHSMNGLHESLSMIKQTLKEESKLKRNTTKVHSPVLASSHAALQAAPIDRWFPCTVVHDKTNTERRIQAGREYDNLHPPVFASLHAATRTSL